MKNLNLGMAALFTAALLFSSCDDDDNIENIDNDNETVVEAPEVDPEVEEPGDDETDFVGAVYVMTNGEGQVPDAIVQGPNSIVTYGRNADGTLDAIGIAPTDGNGGDFDGGEGLDPLISAYAITKTEDNAFVLAVNAGSNTISALPVNADFSLGTAVTAATSAEGPNSIDTWTSDRDGINSLVMVSNITRSEFLEGGEPMHRGTVDTFWLTDAGELVPAGQLDLDNRPSCVHISPDGTFAIVASINAGAAGLDVGATDNMGTDSTAVGNEDEIVLVGIDSDGQLSRWAGATSTLRGNADQRNLPSAIGSQIVEGADGDFYAVVTEAREFQYNGLPPEFPLLQSGSVSTWRINGTALEAVDLDVPAGEDGSGRTACWLDFNADNSLFYVSNAIEATIATYSFDNGFIDVVNPIAASGVGVGDIDNGPEAFAVTEGWIDLWISDDSEYLYQLYGLSGTVGVFRLNGDSLEFIEAKSGNLPDNNTQGIVAM